jgi:RING-type zinc-finger
LRKLEFKLNEAQQFDKRPLYEKVGQWVRDHTKERQEDGGEVDENEPEPEEETRRRAFGRSNFGSNFSLVKYLQTLDEKEMLTRCICSLCHDVAVDPQITDCHHVFCKACIQEEATRSAQEENEVTACPACHMIYLTLTPWFDELTAREYVQSSASSTRAQDEGGNSKSDKNSSSWLNMEGELLPSAKTIALKALILEWMAEAPNEKIVIFTQFRLM